MYRHMGSFPQSIQADAPRARRTAISTRWALSAVTLSAVLIVAACTTVTDGAAHRSPGGPPPGAVDVSLLDTGNYPTRPAAPIGAAGTPEKGAITEGVRMAEHVVGPWEVDAKLTQGVRPTTVYQSPASLQQLLLERDAAVAGRHNFVTGFSSARRTEPDRVSLVNAVLRFPDPQSAAAAVTEFGEVALQPNDDLPTAQPVPVPNHPGTRASTFETTPPGSTAPETSVSAYTAQGPFVLHQFADTPDGVGPAVDMIAKTLDKQIPAIDAFVPTPVSELAGLPVDDGGLLARTIPESGDAIPAGANQVYRPDAALHFQSSPVTSAQLFADTGMDLWARGKASVYRVRDGEAAAKTFEQFVSEAQDSGGKPVAPVPNMPDSHCTQHDEPLSTYVVCFAAVDRYLIEAGSAQIADAHQLTAAQYAMLMAS